MIKIVIAGMNCASCVPALEATLRALPGIDDARIDVRSETAVIHGAPDLEQVIAAIQDQGFQADVLTA